MNANSMIDEDEIFAALDATWPAAAAHQNAGWLIRDGAGGGKRVSAASRIRPDAEISSAVDAMAALGQTPLFQIRTEEADLDDALASKNFEIVDPVWIYAASTEILIDGQSEQSRIYRCELPIAAQREIWADGGIGPERLSVMDRAAGPKTWLMSRLEDRPAAAAFVSAPGRIAMIHAIETATAKRRRGAARALISGAATFAASAGASTLALAVTKANVGANRLYQSLGMEVVAEYHYRHKR